MIKIGLTGGIGSGKSTVSNMFKEKGIKVIDADLISRKVLNIYPQINNTIREHFGDEYFSIDGKLDRRKLGNFIFKFDSKRKELEDIILPYIKIEINNKLEKYEKKGISMCIVDAPTLIESGMYKKMNINILVYVDKETQIQRVMIRDSLRIEEVLNRINSQMPLDEKREFVDYIIDNSKDLLNTKKELSNLFEFINFCVR